MYKGKVWIWIMVAAIACCMSWFVNLIMHWDENHKKYTLYTNIEDVTVANNFSEVITGIFDSLVFNMASSSENADIIIEEHSDKVISGYKKYEKFLYTPIITCAIDAWDDDSGFDKISNRTIATFDFSTLLKAFEDGKEYSDIGISTDYLKGKIKIGIPTETSYYYNDIVELFYYSLNNNTLPANEERKQLEDKVMKLLNMCIKCENIKSCIKNAFSDDDNKVKEAASVLYLIPESMAVKDITYFHTSNGTRHNDSKWKLVYPNSAIVHYYDIYVKEKEHDNILKVIKKCSFSSSTGLRMKKGENLSDTYIVPTSLNIKN